MPDRATHCPGCHGSGIEMSGVTYAGISEYVGCHECGPECPDDCGCRVGPERHESVAPRHPGATQSPDGSPRAAEGLRGAESAVTDAEAARWGALADAVSRRTEQAMTEADACAAAYPLIGHANRVPYAGDPDLKRLRQEARDALMTLNRALYAKAFALLDADNPKEVDHG